MAFVLSALLGASCSEDPPPLDQGSNFEPVETDATATETTSDTATTPSTTDTYPVFCDDYAPSTDRIVEDISYLSSEELFGRAPGSAGNQLALDFVESSFVELGLVPAGDAGSYRQAFECGVSHALTAQGIFPLGCRRFVSDSSGARIYDGCPCSSPLPSENVLGALPGQDPEVGDEVVIIGAHVDHLSSSSPVAYYPGADDNASGVAMMLELARRLVCSDAPPARTVLFAAWNAEECGLVGSCHYAAHPSFPLSQTAAAFSVDCVAGGNAQGLVAYGKNSAVNRALYQTLDEALDSSEMASYDLLAVAETGGSGYSSDHKCFASQGLPALMLSTLPKAFESGGHDHLHTTADTVENINPNDLNVAWQMISVLMDAVIHR